MKLTEKDREYLNSIGEQDNSILQIETAISSTTYTCLGKRISRKKALALFGREKYLSGIARSTFHWNAVQITEDEEEVLFDSSKFFRSEAYK